MVGFGTCLLSLALIQTLSPSPVLYECSISENRPAHSVVCDLDDFLDYSTLSNGPLQLTGRSDEFKINEENVLITKLRIDRELLIEQKKCRNQDKMNANEINCQLNLDVITMDKKIIPIKVNILDVNDNVPKFDAHLSNGLSFQILEDRNTDPKKDSNSEGSQRFISELPFAVDHDYGVNGSIIYALEGSDHGKFVIKEQGSLDGMNQIDKLSLFIEEPINYEEKSLYKFNLIAYNNISSGYQTFLTKSSLPISVEILDINEFKPEFDFEKGHLSSNQKPISGTGDKRDPSSVVVYVPENFPTKMPIFRVHARDGDRMNDKNNSVKFQINQVASSAIRSAFRLNEQDGNIYLLKQLNYESGDVEYSIPILAIDSGYPALTSSGTVVVRVVDMNDEPPHIQVAGIQSSDSLTDGSIFTLKENEPVSSFIAQIKVDDKDTGRGGDVHCILVNSRPFTSYNIDNLNSLSPSELFRIVEVTEKNHDGRDKKETSFKYHLLSNKVFDREEKNMYVVDIVCSDFGNEITAANNMYGQKPRQLISQKQMTIKITDVNDNGPRFVNSRYVGSIDENLDSIKTILTLDVLDLDRVESNRNLFRLSPTLDSIEEIKKYFILNETTGELTNSMKAFDRETRAMYKFSIDVYDEGNPDEWIDTCEVVVNINDINDNPPELLQPAIYEVDEQTEARRGYTQKVFIGRLNATDRDLGRNAEITYQISDQFHKDLSKYWSIRPDGSIYAHVSNQFSLDRENETTHLLPILITDSGQPMALTTSATVTIILRDVNDNAPIFERPQQQQQANGLSFQDRNSPLPSENIKVCIDEPIDSVIYQVYARDLDEGMNAQVTYQIQKNVNEQVDDYFTINETTGEIRIARSLSLDDKKVPRKLVVIASDAGVEKRKSFAFLFIEMKTREMFQQEKLAEEKAIIRDSLLLNNHYPNSINDPELLSKGLSAHNESKSSSPWISEVALGLGIGLILIMAICLTGLICFYVYNKRDRQHGHNGILHPDEDGSYFSRFLCCCYSQFNEPSANLKYKTAVMPPSNYTHQNVVYETLNMRKGQNYYTREIMYPIDQHGNWYQTASRPTKQSQYECIMPNTVKKTPTMSSLSGNLESRHATPSEGIARFSDDDLRNGDIIRPIPTRLPRGHPALPNHPETDRESSNVYSTTINISPDTMVSEERSGSSQKNDSSVEGSKQSHLKHHAGYVVGSPNYSSSFV